MMIQPNDGKATARHEALILEMESVEQLSARELAKVCGASPTQASLTSAAVPTPPPQPWPTTTVVVGRP